MRAPRSPRARLSALRRDVQTLTGLLRGRRPAPTIRTGTQERRASGTRILQVREVVQETSDAVSLWLDPVDGAPITYAPGQFLTLLVPFEGSVLRRAYSLSSAPGLDRGLRITVKRQPDGRISGLLCGTAAVGQRFDVRGPSGRFILPPSSGSARRLLLVGAGSGITPLFGVLRQALSTEPDAQIALLYGNRAPEDVIFGDALRALAAEHPDRFTFREILETPPEDWDGGVGRLDAPTITRELDALDEAFFAGCHEVMLCGPAGMMTAARAVLRDRGLDDARIREERFGSHGQPTAAVSKVAQAVVLRRASGQESKVVAAPGQTVLEAALAASEDMPFSCTLGGCGACRVRLVEGSVAMEEPHCLDPSEVADGYVLTCVGRATSPCTLEVP